MSLNGKIFAISGTLSQPRQYYVDYIAANGGVFSSSVTKKVNYLIVEDPTMSTAKIEKAKKDGTAIISEKELLGLSSRVAPVVTVSADTVKGEKPKAAVKKAELAKAKVVIDTELKKGPLSGMTIALTGRLSKSKEDYIQLISQNGGTYAGTVTKKCTHLVAKDSDGASDKIQKAQKYGAKIVNEDFILNLKPVVTEGDAKTEQTEAPPAVLLAETYEPGKYNLIGWWISEKLDGVRAYWNGKRLMSRNGNEFFPPQWFIEKLPKDRHLDGELFIGRKKFKETISIVKSHKGGDRWKEITYMVFDMPSEAERPFEERMELLADVCNGLPNVQIVQQTQFTSDHDIDVILKEIEELGGEGAMLRAASSKYVGVRSKTLLKVKSFFDAEAKVTGYKTEGRGRLKGATGSLHCVTRAGVAFDCGSGLTDEDRRHPPPIGSIITFKYQELSSSGRPRFPTYVGLAIDKTFP